MLDNPFDAAVATKKGMVALAAKSLSAQLKYLRKNILRNKDVALSVVNIGGRTGVVDDLIQASILQCCFSGGALPTTEQAFKACCAKVGELTAVANEYETLLLSVLVPAIYTLFSGY